MQNEMRLSVICLLLTLSALTTPSEAQITDDFSDGDLRTDPSWIGDLDRWRTGLLGDDPALQSSGDALNDTIYLALRTEAAFGKWEFTFAHQNVNLSTFNGARILIAADTSDPTGPIIGYFVQLGTNNSDAISLWRVDGDMGRRAELGRSSTPLVQGDSSLLPITVERDTQSRWRVSVADSVVLTATDSRYQDGRHLVLWVKHTQQGASSFFFDDLSVEALESSEPPPAERGPLPRPGDIVINEIQFDPLPGTSEFVELYNASDSSFDLQGVTFRDSRASAIEIVDTAAYLQPGGFAVIAADQEAFAAQFRRTPFYSPSRWAALNNGGDSFVVEFEGTIIDSMAYPADVTPSGYSLERIDPAGPSELSNFGPSVNPFGATPGATNSIFAIDLDGPRLLFAEQVTAGSIRLYFDEPLDESRLERSSIRIGNVQPDSLSAGTGMAVTAHFSTLPVTPSVEVYGAFDRRGNASERLSAEIAFIPNFGEVVITEVMYEPLTDSYDGLPNQTEYVELANRSPRLISLGYLRSTRRADELGDADTLDISLDQVALMPGALYVVADDSTLAHQLSDLIVSVRPLSLPNGGDVFRLGTYGDVMLDSLAYGGDLHHPDQLETRGIALERIDVHGPSNSSNWTSSVDETGGTPGRPNSVSPRMPPEPSAPGIVISPNPFSPDRDGIDDVATINYVLRSDISLVRLRIFDVYGVLVRELVSSELVNGRGRAYWNGLDEIGRPLRVGVYVLLLQAYDGRDHIAEAHKAVVVLARKL